jgi:hypothetical protein
MDEERNSIITKYVDRTLSPGPRKWYVYRRMKEIAEERNLSFTNPNDKRLAELYKEVYREVEIEMKSPIKRVHFLDGTKGHMTRARFNKYNRK